MAASSAMPSNENGETVTTALLPSHSLATLHEELLHALKDSTQVNRSVDPHDYPVVVIDSIEAWYAKRMPSGTYIIANDVADTSSPNFEMFALIDGTLYANDTDAPVHVGRIIDPNTAHVAMSIEQIVWLIRLVTAIDHSDYMDSVALPPFPRVPRN